MENLFRLFISLGELSKEASDILGVKFFRILISIIGIWKKY